MFDVNNLKQSDLYQIELKAVVSLKSNYKKAYSGKKSCNYLAYVFNGQILHEIGNTTLLASTDSILFLNKNQQYTVTAIEPGDFIAIHFNCIKDLDADSCLYKLNNTNVLKNLFLKIKKSWFCKGESYYLDCLSIFYNILSLLIQQQPSDHNYLPKNKLAEVRAAASYIRLNYTDRDLNTKVLSGMNNMSEQYFRYLFKKVYGSSPVKYINSIRIDTAKELLSTNDYSIGRIAEIVGFPDIYYFSNMFKKETGVNPSDYRKSVILSQ